MKEIIVGIYRLFFFNPHTDFSRSTEIFLGILAWVSLLNIALNLIDLTIKS